MEEAAEGKVVVPDSQIGREHHKTESHENARYRVRDAVANEDEYLPLLAIVLYVCILSFAFIIMS